MDIEEGLDAAVLLAAQSRQKSSYEGVCDDYFFFREQGIDSLPAAILADGVPDYFLPEHRDGRMEILGAFNANLDTDPISSAILASTSAKFVGGFQASRKIFDSYRKSGIDDIPAAILASVTMGGSMDRSNEFKDMYMRFASDGIDPVASSLLVIRASRHYEGMRTAREIYDGFIERGLGSIPAAILTADTVHYENVDMTARIYNAVVNAGTPPITAAILTAEGRRMPTMIEGSLPHKLNQMVTEFKDCYA